MTDEETDGKVEMMMTLLSFFPAEQYQAR